MVNHANCFSEAVQNFIRARQFRVNELFAALDAARTDEALRCESLTPPQIFIAPARFTLSASLSFRPIPYFVDTSD